MKNKKVRTSLIDEPAVKAQTTTKQSLTIDDKSRSKTHQKIKRKSTCLLTTTNLSRACGGGLFCWCPPPTPPPPYKSPLAWNVWTGRPYWSVCTVCGGCRQHSNNKRWTNWLKLKFRNLLMRENAPTATAILFCYFSDLNQVLWSRCRRFNLPVFLEAEHSTLAGRMPGSCAELEPADDQVAGHCAAGAHGRAVAADRSTGHLASSNGSRFEPLVTNNNATPPGRANQQVKWIVKLIK